MVLFQNGSFFLISIKLTRSQIESVVDGTNEEPTTFSSASVYEKKKGKQGEGEARDHKEREMYSTHKINKSLMLKIQ
jgi:hypothetical protein